MKFEAANKLGILCFLAIVIVSGCSKHDDTKRAPPAALNLLATPAQRPSLPAPSTVQRAYAVGKVGVVRLTFPTNWADGIRQIKGPEKTLDMIQFLPVNGESFEALIHIEYIGKEAAEKILPRMKLAQIGKDELTHSVETSLALQDFQGAGGAGCYFIVTDKSFSMLEEPPKGQYRYLMEGYTQIDGLAIVFWLTSNHIANQQAAVLSMIESAEFKTNAVGQSEPPH